jgi:hypothetical protein
MEYAQEAIDSGAFEELMLVECTNPECFRHAEHHEVQACVG